MFRNEIFHSQLISVALRPGALGSASYLNGCFFHFTWGFEDAHGSHDQVSMSSSSVAEIPNRATDLRERDVWPMALDFFLPIHLIISVK